MGRNVLRRGDEIMRIRPLIGGVLSLGILATCGFLVFVWLTTDVDTQPMWLISSISGLAVGLFLCIRVPDNNMGPVVLVAILSFSLIATYPLVEDWGVTNGHPTVAMFASIGGTLAFGGILTTLLVLLPTWFPDGVAINAWSRWAARTAIALMAIGAVGTALSGRVCVEGGEGNGCFGYVTNPWGISGFDGSVTETLYVGISLLAVPSVVAVILRWRRSKGVERAQLKWFSLAAVLFIVAFLAGTANESTLGTDLGAWLAVAVLCAVWVSIGVAVTKYRLYDIDRVISRGLGYTLVVGVLALVYALGAVWLPTRLIGQQDPVFVAGSTLAVAALFRPLRSRVLRAVDRRFYRSRYDFEAINDDFATALRGDLDLDRIPDAWVEVVVETLHPSSVGMWLRGA